MSVKTGDGPAAFANGTQTPDWFYDFISAPLTLTNALLADGFVNADTGFMWKLDLNGVSQVRLTGRVTTASASVNSPKLQLRYATAFTTTPASILQLGESSVEISMFTGTTTDIQDSGWINLKAAARIPNCYLMLMNIGGDGAADPVVNQVIAAFR